MKFRAYVGSMKRNLRMLQPFVGKAGRVSLPVLSCVKITAKDRMCVTLEATNLERGAHRYIDAQIDIEGAVVLPYALLTESINVMDNEDVVTFEKAAEGYSVRLTNGDGQYKFDIEGVSPDEFPPIREPIETPMLSATASDLSLALAQAIPAAAREDNRPVLLNVFFKRTSDTDAHLLTADGFRAHRCHLQCVWGEGHEKGFLLPARSAAVLVGILKEVINEHEHVATIVQLCADQNHNYITLQLALEHYYVFQVDEGRYPDVDALIPSVNGTQVEVAFEEVSQMIRAAALYAERSDRDGSQAITLAILPDAVEPQSGLFTITAHAPLRGSALTSNVEKTGKVKITGEPQTKTANMIFVRDAVACVAGDVVLIQLGTSNGTPIVISTPRLEDEPIRDAQFVAVVMPMSVR